MSALPPRTARVPDRVVWINGTIVRGGEAVISVFDRGARDGGGIFETVRVYAGRPFAWLRHMERLVLSAAELGFPVPPSPGRLRDAVGELLAAQSLEDAVVRLTVTRGIAGGRPTITGAWIEAEPVAGRLWPGTRRGGAGAMFSAVPFQQGWIGRHKTTSRMAWDLAREEARAAGADEALLVAPGGHVLEGAASNMFWVEEGEVLTPPLAQDVLPGVTRAVVLELCRELGLRHREAPVSREQLELSEEIFLTNSVQEVLPVSSLAGRPVAVGPKSLQLHAAYRERVARER